MSPSDFQGFLGQVKGFLAAVEKDEEVFALQAKLLKKMYEALIVEGFTRVEATQIVAAQGTGIKGNS